MPSIQEQDQHRKRSPEELKSLGFVKGSDGQWRKADVQKELDERKRKANANRAAGKQDFGY